MSKFVYTLVAEKINPNNNSGRGTWRLVTCLPYESDLLNETVIVPEGFQTDFSSVPRMPGIFALFGGRGDLAGVVHDYLYDRSCTLSIDRKTADKVFKEALVAQGVKKWIAHVMYLGVRLGASSHFRK